MEPASTVLIVDDEQTSRRTLEGVLRLEGYNLVFASSGEEALALAEAHLPDVVLLDVMMPGMDGFEVCRHLRASDYLADVPIVIVTALDDRDSRLHGLDAGADDFISKPFDRMELRTRVRTITRLNRYRRLLAERTRFERMIELLPDGLMIVDSSWTIHLVNSALMELLGVTDRRLMLGALLQEFVAADEREQCFDWLHSALYGAMPATRCETVFLRGNAEPFPVSLTAGHFMWDGSPMTQVIVRDITERKRAEEQLRRSHQELALAYDGTLEGWSRALDLRDKETEGHSQRVTTVTVRLARAIGLSESEVVHIQRGALLHDIGKMGIPDGILLKPGPLLDDEWEVMRKHPVYAYELLAPITFLAPAMDIPYCHHEKWDGTGYPRGLRGEEIPLAARIFAVVDVWDALSSERPYRSAWPPERVCAHIQALSGSHFDPQVVEAFFRLESDL